MGSKTGLLKFLFLIDDSKPKWYKTPSLATRPSAVLVLFKLTYLIPTTFS